MHGIASWQAEVSMPRSVSLRLFLGFGFGQSFFFFSGR